jgi:hypothetical protein
MGCTCKWTHVSISGCWFNWLSVSAPQGPTTRGWLAGGLGPPSLPSPPWGKLGHTA